MSEKSTTPDLVERAHRQREDANRRDIDAVMSSFAVDAVLEGRALGDVFEGQEAIRAFLDRWFGMYDALEFKFEEIHDLGNGVVFAVVVQEARPTGIAGRVRQREGWVYLGAGGLIARLAIFEIDEARTAAERLAEERASAMSQEKVEIVRQLIALGEQVRAGELISPPLDLVTADMEIDLSRRVFNPEIYRGFDGLVRLNDQLREVWAEWQVTPERLVAVGDQVVSIETARGRGRGSGLETGGRYASIWTFVDGRVARVEIGLDPEEALKAVGLEE